MKSATLYTLPCCPACEAVQQALRESGHNLTVLALAGCSDPVVLAQLDVQGGAAPVVLIDDRAVDPLAILSGRPL